jgi:hypothetical protein
LRRGVRGQGAEHLQTVDYAWNNASLHCSTSLAANFQQRSKEQRQTLASCRSVATLKCGWHRVKRRGG